MYTKNEIRNAIVNFLVCNLGELESVIVEINHFDGSFSDMVYYDNDSDFFNDAFERPSEVIHALSNKYNPNEAYVRIDDDLYLESLDEESYQDMLLDNVNNVVDKLLIVDTSRIYLTPALKEMVTLYQKYDSFSDMFKTLETIVDYNY